ncbi:MAG: ATP-binding protein, partial [Candidatus Tectomicrobia bacterium]|nr:ATP-binding protein [Candidatus Tectomicrobia bacterium]
LDEDAISLYVTNSVNPDSVGDFQQFIQRLVTEDTDELFLDQLMRNAEAENGDGSGLGYLTMINDYGATLAWQFTPLAPDATVMTVTTMARMPV